MKKLEQRPVLAGNLDQFSYFVADLIKGKDEFTIRKGELIIDGKRYFYLSRPDQLSGLRNYELIFCGTATEREDVQEFRDLYKQSQWESKA